VHEAFGALAKRVNAALASPWAIVVALALVAAYFVFGPAIGLPQQPLELSFLLTLSTFILVFLIQHETYRDSAATQVKLDAKIGIEERPPKEIDSVRESVRKNEGQRSVG